jgi:hypothetical protein
MNDFIKTHPRKAGAGQGGKQQNSTPADNKNSTIPTE